MRNGERKGAKRRKKVVGRDDEGGDERMRDGDRTGGKRRKRVLGNRNLVWARDFLNHTCIWASACSADR